MDELLEELSSLELAEWNAYFKVEPFGAVFEDMHFAALESLIANANRKKGTSPIHPKKFMLHQPGERENAQDLWSRLKSWALFEKGREKPE